jgi:hypothetical protein
MSSLFSGCRFAWRKLRLPIFKEDFFSTTFSITYFKIVFGQECVATADGECKFWLDPVRLARNKGISPIRVRGIERLVFENLTFLKEKYYEFHSP